MKKTIEVEVTNIDVDSEYYTYDYKVIVDGKVFEEGEVNEDYSNGMTPKQWKKCLGVDAWRDVLVRVFE